MSTSVTTTADHAPPAPPAPIEAPDPAGEDALKVPPRLFLYDGVCGLCNKVVQFLLKHDREGSFHFAPLQGETTEALKARHDTIPDDVETVVYIEERQVYLRSKAILMAAQHMTFPWRLAYHPGRRRYRRPQGPDPRRHRW